MLSSYYSYRILKKLEFFPQIFEKSSNMKFDQNSSTGSRVVLWRRTDGRTDRHDDDNSRFLFTILRTPTKPWNFLHFIYLSDYTGSSFNQDHSTCTYSVHLGQIIVWFSSLTLTFTPKPAWVQSFFDQVSLEQINFEHFNCSLPIISYLSSIFKFGSRTNNSMK